MIKITNPKERGTIAKKNIILRQISPTAADLTRPSA